MLYDSRETLRALLTWPPLVTASPGVSTAPRRPELVVVLVDADEEPQRLQMLESWVEDLPVDKVIGVPVQEFEAWLLADDAACNSVFGATLDPLPELEAMPRRAAKEALDERSRDCCPDKPERIVRQSLASVLDLDVAARRCGSLRTFRARLARSG
ncbi:MAG: hypothetical protein WKG00_09620 [Polyangiaceae bacterium]